MSALTLLQGEAKRVTLAAANDREQDLAAHKSISWLGTPIAPFCSISSESLLTAEVPAIVVQIPSFVRALRIL